MSEDSDGFQKLITGSITAISQSIDLSSPNQSTEIVQLTGTWSGTLLLEGSNDNSNFSTILAINHSNYLLTSSFTANGTYTANTNGFGYVRIRSSAWTSGTADIYVYGSDAASLIFSNSLIRGSSDGTLIGNSTDSLKVVSRTQDNSGTGITSTTVSAKQGLDVNILNTTAVTSSIVDKSTFTYGVSTEQPIGGVYQDTSPGLTAGQTGALRSTANRALHVNLRNSSGNEADFDAGATGAQTLRTQANQGAPNTLANAWPEKITDGTYTVKVTPNQDLGTSDLMTTSALDGAVALTTTPVAIRVGGANLANRKYVIIEGLSTNIKWGFSNTTTTFDIFKDQILMIPIGPGVTLWAKVTAATGSIGIGELA
jgi:hypothetical protein